MNFPIPATALPAPELFQQVLTLLDENKKLAEQVASLTHQLSWFKP